MSDINELLNMMQEMQGMIGKPVRSFYHAEVVRPMRETNITEKVIKETEAFFARLLVSLKEHKYRNIEIRTTDWLNKNISDPDKRSMRVEADWAKVMKQSRLFTTLLNKALDDNSTPGYIVQQFSRSALRHFFNLYLHAGRIKKVKARQAALDFLALATCSIKEIDSVGIRVYLSDERNLSPAAVVKDIKEKNKLSARSRLKDASGQFGNVQTRRVRRVRRRRGGGLVKTHAPRASAEAKAAAQAGRAGEVDEAAAKVREFGRSVKPPKPPKIKG